jgi:hypothetical protein
VAANSPISVHRENQRGKAEDLPGDAPLLGRAALGVHLGVLATRAADGWLLAHYQVSYLA